MRIVVSPAGSRGDFQPLLALGLGLRAAGHDVRMVSSPNFGAEAEAFGLPFQPIGPDNEVLIRSLEMAKSKARASYDLFRLGRRSVDELIDEGIRLTRGAEVLVGAGAQITAPTIAEALGIPYIYVAYTPQALWSSHHPPFMIPIHGLPRLGNRLLWRMLGVLVRVAFGGPINRKRRALGLPPMRDWYDHAFPRKRTLVAADPELAQVAPDSPLAFPATGSWHLPDARPLSPELERFLAAGPAPVYIGFGSMPDAAPAKTTGVLVEAARAAGVRLLLARGWAGHGDGVSLGDRGMVLGPTSHALLFPRVAACVHHGGAGTTSAAARAGRPQVIVPHAFDQFQWGRWVNEAGVGPAPIRRTKLTAESLSAALRAALEPACAQRASELGERLRGRDSIAAGIAGIERLACRPA